MVAVSVNQHARLEHRRFTGPAGSRGGMVDVVGSSVCLT
jgi:hypothetical protein